MKQNVAKIHIMEMVSKKYKVKQYNYSLLTSIRIGLLLYFFKV